MSDIDHFAISAVNNRCADQSWLMCADQSGLMCADQSGLMCPFVVHIFVKNGASCLLALRFSGKSLDRPPQCLYNVTRDGMK